MELKIINLKDSMPKRGKVIFFSEGHAQADFYYLDNKGDAWSKTDEASDWEYACPSEQLVNYDWGHYTHWARVDKVFNIDFDIPKD